jgi:LacI family transcriptional regulator
VQQRQGDNLPKTRKRAVRRGGRAVTIHDVAAHAGVSPMTVSRAVNRSGNVREFTRERVLRAVQELGYTPNLAASSLAAASDLRIALIYTNPSESYLRELLVGALRGATRNAAQLVIEAWEGFDAAAQRDAVRTLAGSVAGVILPPPLCESQTVVAELVHAGVPAVAIASDRFADRISSVHVEDFRASHEITAHVIARGHRRIGSIMGDASQLASARRLEGFVAALREAGIAPERSLVEQGHFTYRSGVAAGEKPLSRRRPPTAIIAGNADMAAAVVSVAPRRGMDVPRDLSVAGFDDTSAATMAWPALTTIRQPIAAMAELALDILLRRPGNGKRAVAMVDHVVPHVLVKRGSIAPPAPGA